MEKKNWFKWKH
ncbi:Protein of unknown function [Bacillus mycoides]|nr:Protein of unknown function [Bacillus mycoides]